MATGYEDSRFEKKVDENLHCVICTEVLKDPVQCRRNEHHFCRKCIVEHLKHSPKCPTCQDPLTVKTLAKPQRFLANTLACLKISCDNSSRGCRKVVELGSLATHVASCEFGPMPCSNDQCEEIISQRDKEIHENKVCDFRQVKCDYCSQTMLYKNFMQHTCPPRQEIREMNAELREARKQKSEIKAELREVRSRQEEMFKIMQNMMLSLTRLERNMVQRSEVSHAGSGQEVQAEIVVTGGFKCKSVEVFNMATKTWRQQSQTNECRHKASSVLYQGRMIVAGGMSVAFQYLDSVEEVNLTQQDGRWVESQFKLPVPSRGHTCVVYQSRLLLIGGLKDFNTVNNTIYETQLTPPYTSRLLTKMPQPICYHGAEIVNGKIYIIGGSTTGGSDSALNTVLMFDPASNTCTELKPLPYAVARMATTTWKDNLVIVGGVNKERNTRNTVILYNVTTGSHCMLPEMTRNRHSCTAVTIGDNVVAIGGFDEINNELDSVECYNFHTNTWTEFPAMTEARAHHNSVVKYC